MADDQKPKTMDIDDLVRELSKSSTSPATPQASTPLRPPLPTPPSPSIKPTMPSTMAGSPTVPVAPKPPMPKPQFNVSPPAFSQPQPMTGQALTPGRAGGQAKPAPTPTTPVPPASPPTTSGVKEYQSSIRTMNEDISKIKQGQQPMGVPVPRKVEQIIPAPQPQPMPPKPSMSAPQFKVPSVNLGETQKSAPLAQSKDFSKPGPLMPPPPPPSVKPTPTKPVSEPKPEIYIPQEGQKMVNRDMLFLGIGAVAILAGFSYWFFVLRSPAPEVVIESPTPSPTATPVATLNELFPGQALPIAINPERAAEYINLALGFLPGIDGGSFKKISFAKNQEANKDQDISAWPDIEYLSLSEVVPFPSSLKDLLGNESLAMVYGQKEIFDSKGQRKLDAPVEKRLVFVFEVRDSSAALQAMTTWEPAMVADLKELLLITSKKNESFSNTSYINSAIRYRNFPWPDRSIDYGVVSASNGKSYLIIAGSRESMFSSVEMLKGISKSSMPDSYPSVSPTP